jgi:hypothetical protein
MFNFSKKKLNKFRLLVETDRWHNVSRADRLYHRRNSDDRRDEFHNIMSCYYLKQKSSTDFRKESNFGAKGDNSYIKPNNLQLTSEKRVISDQRETILI